MAQTFGENPINADNRAGPRDRSVYLLVFGSAQLMLGIVYSLLAPVYPGEAELKGLSAAEYEFVIGLYELTAFLYGPVVQLKTRRFPMRAIFYAGLLTMGSATILFGFLNRMDGHLPFLAVSILLRIVQACGMATTYVVSMSCTMLVFPETAGKIAALLQTMIGIGTLIGPGLAGVLVQYGGFTLPFAVVGTACFVVGAMAYLLLHQSDGTSLTNNRPASRTDYTIWSSFKLLLSPAVLLDYVTVVITLLCMSALIASLEPSLRQFSLSLSTVGLVFVAYNGAYSLAMILTGFAADRIARKGYITLLGLCLILIGYFCKGPLYLLISQRTIGLYVGGLLLIGAGNGALNVSCILQIIQRITSQFPNDEFSSTTGNGLYFSAVCLGGFIGPTLDGALWERIGLDNTAFVYLALLASLIVANIGGLLYVSREASKTEEETFLLNKEND